MALKDIWKDKKDGSTGDIIYADDMENGGINQLANEVLRHETVIDNVVTEPSESTQITKIIAMEYGNIHPATGELSDNSRRIRSVDFIPLVFNTSYQITCDKGYQIYILFYDKNKNFLWHEDTLVGSGTFVCHADSIGYLKIRTSGDENDLTAVFTLTCGETGHGYYLNADKVFCNNLVLPGGQYDLGNDYSIGSSEIDPGLYKAWINKNSTEFNIFEIHAPDAKPYEATLALMQWGKGIKQFVDFSSMHYSGDLNTPGSVEIVNQTRGGFPLPIFTIAWNDGNGAGRVRKFTVQPDAIPIELTSEGLRVRRNNNFNNSSDEAEYALINLAELEGLAGKVSYLFEKLNVPELQMSFQFDDVNGKTLGGSLNLTGPSGTYDLYWLNQNGAILEEFEAFATVKAPTTLHIMDHIIPPEGAIKLGAYRAGACIATCDIPAGRRYATTNYGTPEFTLGLLSDTHVDGVSEDKAQSKTDFTRALSYFQNQAVDAIIINGDVTYNGNVEDYEMYVSLLAEQNLSMPVYTSRGNHDCNTTINNYITYMQPEGTHYEKAIGDQILLFVGMRYHDFLDDCFSDATITWLEEKLEQYKNKRVLLFCHPFMRGTSGDPIGLYGYDTLNETSTKVASFCNMMRKYKNVVYFSGHSHFTLRMQKFSDYANIYDNGTMCHRVHIPSCAKPRTNDKGLLKEETYTIYEGSEGYLCEVYADCIVLKGRDFVTGKFIPQAHYRLDTALVAV